MTVHQLQETQAEITSGLKAAGRLASKARNAHNATISRLRAEAEAIEARKAEADEEQTRWEAKHAMIQRKLAKKGTHSITLGSNLGSHHITFEVTLPESSPETIISGARESSPEGESTRSRSVHLPPGQTVETIDAGRASFKGVTRSDTLAPVVENAGENRNYAGRTPVRTL